MIGRRSILQLAIGCIATAQSKSVSGQSLLDMPQQAYVGSGNVPVCDAEYPAWRQALDQAMWAKEATLNGAVSIPLHIASKKSWSTAFKFHEAEREHRALRDLRDKINRDAEFAERVAKALGVL